MKKKLLLLTLLCCLMMISNVTMANAATKWRTATESKSAYSWLGLKCYTINVLGNYSYNDVTDSMLTWNDTNCSTNTYVLWNSSNHFSYWSNRDVSCSVVRGTATFILGFINEENYFGVQNHDDEVVAFTQPWL